MHVLGMPPAFILSQDQTLVKRKLIKTKINLMPKVLAAHAVLSSADHTVKVHPEPGSVTLKGNR